MCKPFLCGPIGLFFVLLLAACPAVPVRQDPPVPVLVTDGPFVSPSGSPDIVPQPSALPADGSVPTALPGLTDPTPSPGAPTSASESQLLPSTVLFGSSGGGASGGGGSASVVPSSPQFQIQDVRLQASGASIMGAAAPAALIPDYAATEPILISVRGRFEIQPALSLDQMRLTHAPGLLHLSLLENELPARLTLNHHIVLTPISVSATEIVAAIHPRGLPDLYLKGLQLLSLTVGERVAETQVKVGEPLTAASLNPVVTQVEVLASQAPVRLKLTGRHLMLVPGHNFVQINGQAAGVHQTAVRQIENGLQWEAQLSWSAAENFEPDQGYDLLLSTPFGVTMTRFGDEGSDP